jgi:hypothetical protein
MSLASGATVKRPLTEHQRLPLPRVVHGSTRSHSPTGRTSSPTSPSTSSSPPRATARPTPSRHRSGRGILRRGRTGRCHDRLQGIYHLRYSDVDGFGLRTENRGVPGSSPGLPIHVTGRHVCRSSDSQIPATPPTSERLHWRRAHTRSGRAAAVTEDRVCASAWLDRSGCEPIPIALRQAGPREPASSRKP